MRRKKLVGLQNLEQSSIQKIIIHPENHYSSGKRLLKKIKETGSMDRRHGKAKGKKLDISDENLLSSTNKMSEKIMISAAILWYGVTKIKVVSKLTKKAVADICVRNCFLLQKKLLYVKIEYLLKIEGHLINPTWYNSFLKQN